MKKNYLLIYLPILAILISITGCYNDDLLSSNSQESTSTNSQKETIDIVERDARPMILGEQLENPFSVENMQNALDFVMAQDEETLTKAGVAEKDFADIEITATDLYVRFLPIDSLSQIKLLADTTLTLFDHPLDCEIIEQGDYYEQKIEGSNFQWYYTTVKPEYTAPEYVKYEVLEELFIMENSEYYSVEVLPEDEANTRSAPTTLENDVLTTLMVASFELTGNADQLKNDEEECTSTRITYEKREQRKFLWKKWYVYQTYYRPDGYIRLQTPNGDVGLKGIKVRFWRWFYYSDTTTDSNGYYISKTEWKPLWMGNYIDYNVFFDGKNNEHSWEIEKSIAGVYCLWRSKYNAGKHHPDGHDITFRSSSSYWGKAVINNAIYDYIDIAENDGITLPPKHLRIADANGNEHGWSSSAPLLNNHLNSSLYDANTILGGFRVGMTAHLSKYVLYPIIGWGAPDLILRYGGLEDYNKTISIVWHELTHASQVEAIKKEKGYNWTSEYWSSNVYQQSANSIAGKGPYGEKGDHRWEQIALSEGWAKFRQRELGRIHLVRKDISYYEKYIINNQYSTSFTVDANLKNELLYNKQELPYYENLYPVVSKTIGAKKHYYRISYDYYDPLDRPSNYNIYYGGMYDELHKVGCSLKTLEKALVAYTIAEYKNNIISLQPSLKEKINDIMIDYE